MPETERRAAFETPPRLASGLWIHACIRRCTLDNLPATVVRKGDPDSGAIMIKVFRDRMACMVLSQTRTPEGDPAWIRSTGDGPVTEPEADAYIDRQISYDRDIWVLEIECSFARLPLDEPVI